MIDVRGISLAYGARVLLDQVSFQLGDKDRLCLGGRNGTGKTTLLKMLAGEGGPKPDNGEIITSKGTRIGYLPQHLTVDGSKTIFEVSFAAFAEAERCAAEADVLRHRVADDKLNEEEIMTLLHELDDLDSECNRLDWWTAESETRRILAGLGFSDEDMDRPSSEFSGGWQMRAALAKVLLEKPDCLLLDEPINHLDIESIVWLESYLKAFSGSMLLIAHDRRFVESVCERLLEIDNSKVNFYPLPFTRYEEEKKMRLEHLQKASDKQEAQIASLEKFVERFKAKASKATLAQSKQKQIDKIEAVRIELPQEQSTIRLRFPEAPPTGQGVFEADELGIAFGEKRVFANAQFNIQSKDKVVFSGPNGAGKTTLLRILLGQQEASEGYVKKGHNVEIGYFAQYEEPTEEEKKKDLLTILGETAPRISPNQIRAILGSMLFSGDDVYKKYGVLSGGERSRVRLCRLLLQKCNVLVLDEPTNHLDLVSKELLMQAMADFGGTILFVSHDRAFVERIATRVIAVRDGRVTEYPGGYEYYLSKLSADRSKSKEGGGKGNEAGKSGKSNAKGRVAGQTQAPGAPGAYSTSSNETVTPPSQKNTSAETSSSTQPEAKIEVKTESYEEKKERERLRRKREKRMQEVEEEIHTIDAKVVKLSEELCKPEIFADPQLCAEKGREREGLDKKQVELYQEMEELEKSLKESNT